MTAATSSQRAMASPVWLVAVTLAVARPLIRAGLWLVAIQLRCAARGQPHSVKRTIAAAGLFCVNLCSAVVGAVLGWLANFIRLSATTVVMTGSTSEAQVWRSDGTSDSVFCSSHG